MTPTIFPQANCRFKAPTDLEESQCMTIDAFKGKVVGGSVDGSDFVVVAWTPTPDELAKLNAGSPIFLSMMGGLAPHFLTTNFDEAIKPA